MATMELRKKEIKPSDWFNLPSDTFFRGYFLDFAWNVSYEYEKESGLPSLFQKIKIGAPR